MQPFKQITIAAIVILGIFSSAPALAEDPPEDDQPKEKSPRWVIYVAGGYKNRVHTAEDFKAGLIEGGYTDGTSGGGFLLPYSSQASPYAITEGILSSFQVGYEPNEKIGYRIFLNRGSLSEGYGRRINQDFDEADRISFTSYLTTVGLLVDYRLAPALRVGLGPAYHHLSVDYLGTTDEMSAKDSQSSGALGLAIEAMLTAPARSLFFVFLGYQRHQVLGINIGPFEDMPETSASISHSVWMLGLGLRFGSSGQGGE